MKTIAGNPKFKNNLCALLVLFSIFYFLFSATQSFAANEEVIKAAQEAAKITLSCSTNPNAYPWCKAEQTPGGFIVTFYQIALGLVGGAALGVLIYGAILYTVSAGNTSKQQDARSWITGAIWGLALLLAAYLILYTINPDLVNISQTQGFLNKLIKPVTISKPTIEDLYRSNDDSKTRIYLESKGNDIGINKDACKSLEDTNCTSVANLPQNAVDGVIKIKKECDAYSTAFYKSPDASQCLVFITGGTEAGHKEHGPGQAVLDLRYISLTGPNGSPVKNNNLMTYIRDKIGLKSGIISPQQMEYNKRYEAKDGSFTVIREKNDQDGTEHFHVVFK